MPSMRAWRLQEQADGQGHLVQNLSLHQVPQPTPGPGQLLVRVHAAGLNRGEFLSGHGALPQGGAALKPVGGEAAGEVVAVGEGVQGWALGQRVMGRCAGAFAQFALMPAFEAMPIPQGLSLEQASALPLVFMVVYDMLAMQAQLREGQTLLVAGVSSGVGVGALQAAKALGAKVVGTSGSAAKLERLKSLGAGKGLDLGLHTRESAFAKEVMAFTGGKGADLAVLTVGGTVFAECLNSLAYEGRLAMVGYVDGSLNAPLDLGTLHAKRLSVFGVSNKLRTQAQKAAQVRAFMKDWWPLFDQGRITPLVDRVLPFEALAEAKASMQAGEHVGKIVLSISGANG